jgi:hypothetical protein
MPDGGGADPVRGRRLCAWEYRLSTRGQPGLDALAASRESIGAQCCRLLAFGCLTYPGSAVTPSPTGQETPEEWSGQ